MRLRRRKMLRCELAEAEDAFLQDADDLDGRVADAERLADRVSVGKERLDGLACRGSRPARPSACLRR